MKRLFLFVGFVIAAAQSGNVLAAPTAEELYAEGQSAYDRGDYETAIATWQRSYDLSGAPALLFNLAQAYRRAGDCGHAISNYRRFIELVPRSDQRPLADELMRELEPECGSPPAPPVEHVPRQTENTGSGHRLKLVGIVTGGTGAALVATGFLFGNRASELGDEVTRDCAVSCEWSTEKTKQSDGKRDATIGKVIDVVGVAAIAAGVGLYIYGARDGGHALTIQPNSTGATMSWSGRW